MDLLSWGLTTWLNMVQGVVGLVGGLMALLGVPEKKILKVALCLFFAVSAIVTVVMTREQERRTRSADDKREQAEQQRDAKANQLLNAQQEIKEGQERARLDAEFMKGQLSMLSQVMAKAPAGSRPATEPISLPKSDRAAVRDQLAGLMAEGAALARRCLTEPNSAPPQAEANAWATKVHVYLRDHLGSSYDVRFLNPPTPLPIRHNEVSEAHDNLWRGIGARVDVLRGFIDELRD